MAAALTTRGTVAAITTMAIIMGVVIIAGRTELIVNWLNAIWLILLICLHLVCNGRKSVVELFAILPDQRVFKELIDGHLQFIALLTRGFAQRLPRFIINQLIAGVSYNADREQVARNRLPEIDMPLFPCFFYTTFYNTQFIGISIYANAAVYGRGH